MRWYYYQFKGLLSMEKPVNIRPEVWEQHLAWMKTMNEGQLTGLGVNDTPYKPKVSSEYGNKNNKEVLK